MNLIETIKYKNGEFVNLELHQDRMNNSRRILWGNDDAFNLETILQEWTHEAETYKLYKCRIIYNKEIQNIEILPYEIPKIKSLKFVLDNSIDYDHKYQNRDRINSLFSHRKNCDDILIVKNNLITDSSYCNVLFFNGKNWLTPERPLLKGTQRQYLINNEIVNTADIRPSDINNFEKVRLINAMISFEDKFDIEIVDLH